MTFHLQSIHSPQRRARRHLASLLTLIMLVLAAPLYAATITVSSLTDTTANDGVCTLREAIIAANTNTASGAAAGECAAGTAGLNVIAFGVAGTLQPSSSMPDITTPIHINGYTAPGAVKNTLPLSGGTNAQLKFEIDGVNAGITPALKLSGSAASGSIIEGLVINNSANPACCAQIGVYVSGVNGAASTLIRGNFFGVDVPGMALRNKGSPDVYVDGATANLVIGSSATGALDDTARNLISGSFNAGVNVSGNMTNLTIRGNLMGSNATGTASLGNQMGVLINGVTNGVIADNLVSGNSAFGIRLLQTNTAVLIARNLIGTNALGNGSIPNTGIGLFIQDSSVATPFTIDNIDVVDNVVANNTCGGVGCSGGIVIGIASPLNTIRGVRLTRNLVYANKGLQIDLATPNGANNYVFGLTANDVGDGDGGPGAPNNLQNFPVLSPAIGNGSSIAIPYALNSEASKTFTLEFFQASVCDANGRGSARVYLGTTNVTTDGTGNASGTVTIVSALTTGVVSATATHAVNGTSELSLCASLSPLVVSVAPTIINASFPPGGTVGLAYSFLIVATGSAPITFSVGTGSLPPGVTINATTGLISGTPTGLGTFTGTIAASNGTLPNGSLAFNIVISPAAVVLPTVSVGNASMVEGNAGTSVMNYPVTLSSAAPAGGVTLTYSTANGTATAGSDYVAVVAGTVTIAAGATTGNLPVTINGDTTVEPDETFTVTITGAINATIGTATATGTIVNDDVVAPLVPVVSVGNASIVEGNAGTQVLNFPVTLSSAAPAGGVTLTYSTANGTATAGSDYVAVVAGTVTIAAGATTGNLPVTINGDTTVEPDETFTVTITGATNATIGTATATGTIVNDDVVAPVVPVVSVGNASMVEGNAGTSVINFPVTLSSAAPVGGVTITYSTANGTATAGSDYVAVVAGSVTIPAGALTGNLPVTINGDTTVEPDETFTVTVASATNAMLGATTATGTIINDDVFVPPPPSVQVPVNHPLALFALSLGLIGFGWRARLRTRRSAA